MAIPGTIFNNCIDALLAKGVISDAQLSRTLKTGGAFQAASASFMQQFPLALQSELRALYRSATQRVFQIAIIFTGVAFLLSLLEKEIKLRKTLDTEFGLKDKKKSNTTGSLPDILEQA